MVSVCQLFQTVNSEVTEVGSWLVSGVHDSNGALNQVLMLIELSTLYWILSLPCSRSITDIKSLLTY